MIRLWKIKESVMSINHIYGYAKASSLEEELICQVKILKELNCTEIITEEMSDKKSERPELTRLKNKVKSGDTVVIESFVRLGRSTKDLIEQIEYFENKEVRVISVKEDFDTATSRGKAILSVFQAFAGFERDLISQRTRERLAKARARGRKGGRPKVKEEHIKKALELYNSRIYSISEIAKMSGVSQATLYRYLVKEEAKEEKKAENNLTADTEKMAKIDMHLRVENNSKFVRGKNKTRSEIEDYLSYHYNMEKPDPDRWEYIFYVKYKTIEELEKEVYDILHECEFKADLRNGFIEADTRCEELDLSW